MTEGTSAILSTQRCCPFIEISSKKTTGHIAIALGIIFLISGIFLTLAAYNVLPSGMNAINTLGIGGYILGYVAIVAGCFVTACGAWRACSKEPASVGAISTFQSQVSQGLQISSVGPSQILAQVQTGSHQPLIDTASEIIIQDSEDQGNAWDTQIKKAAKIDTTAIANTWKSGPGKNEVEQTFEAFETSKAMRANAKRNKLTIATIDTGISEAEWKMLKTVCIYLAIVHGVEVTLTNWPLTNENSRVHLGVTQYAIENYMFQMQENLPKDSFIIGFTSNTLYPFFYQSSYNFVIGQGDWESATGCFSIAQMRISNPQTMLIRLMRVASHEFGHMRGLHHCTNYACCMQGANSTREGDILPLTFCALDMAKICRINGWTLKHGYERQLKFFQGFKNYSTIEADFSAEIQHLERKIQSLTLPSDHLEDSSKVIQS